MKLHKTQNCEDTSEEPKWLSEKLIHDIPNFNYLFNSSRCTCKNPWCNNIICRFLQGIWLYTQREDGAITSCLRPTTPQTVAALFMLYKNTEVKNRSPDGDSDYFDIVTGVLKGDTLAPCLFIICQDYVLWMTIDIMKDNSFKLTKERNRRYPAQTITDADYSDDIALLANIPAQAETQLHCLERVATSIDLHVNADKTEYMCFDQRGDIATLNTCSLKLADKFTYLESSVSSTETDINTRLAKAWKANDSLSVMWKSVQRDKIKHSFFQAAVVSILLYGCSSRTATYHSSRKLSKLDEPDMRDIAGEVGTNL